MKLRALSLADAARVAELVGDYEVSRWTSNIPHPYSLEDAETWITASQGDALRHPFAVEAEGQLVACVSFWPDGSSGVEVGYWVGKSYWGRGIATAALGELLQHESFPRGEVASAKVMNDNLGSQRVLEKCGFVFVEPCIIECRGERIPSRLYRREVPV